MSPVSFDPVAHVYDATRGFPEEVMQQIVEVIEQATNENGQTRFFEVGVGTGRFAVPLVEAGHQYTGIDISEKMMGQLEEKLHAGRWQETSSPWGSMPDEDATRNLNVRRFIHKDKPGTMRIAIADMTAIPFHDASFDVVIAAHVFHLVNNWQQALQEIVRVLRPGGILIRCWEEKWEDLWKPGSRDIRNQWCTIVHELGGDTKHPGASDQEVTDWLHRQGFETEPLATLTWQRPTTPHAIFEGIAQRIWTSTQVVSDDIFAASLDRLNQWMDEQFGDAINEVFLQEKGVVISKTQI